MNKFAWLCLSVAPAAYAQDNPGVVNESVAPYMTGENTGKTLPKGVARVRVPTRFYSGESGFDGRGSKSQNGFSTNVTASALVLEYGLSNQLAIQFLAPFIVSNKLTLNKAKFQKSSVFKLKKEENLNMVAAHLVEAGACPSISTCRAYIDGGGVAPSDQEIPLPNGEKVSVKAGTKITAAVDDLITNAVTPADGETGLGDIEMGVLYDLNLTTPVKVSVGLGLRVPTGKFANVATASQRPTGRGTLDLGLRVNFDVDITPGVIVSWQHQSEQMLQKGEYSISGIVDNTKTTKKEDFSRIGVRNLGFFKAMWGMGNISERLSPFGLYTQYKYDFDAAKKYGDADAGPRSQMASVLTGFVMDGLAYQFPAQLELEYEVPLSGRNQSIATSMLAINLKGYYRF